MKQSSKLKTQMAKANNNTKYYEGVGRRKEAVARVRLYLTDKKDLKIKDSLFKKGEIYINNRPISEIFPSEVEKESYLYPLQLTGSEDKFVVSILIAGGGKIGQLEAIVHGLSRALEKYDTNKLRPTLKKAGLLTRDPRVRERRKVGTGGKARRQKQSPKR